VGALGAPRHYHHIAHEFHADHSEDGTMRRPPDTPTPDNSPEDGRPGKNQRKAPKSKPAEKVSCDPHDPRQLALFPADASDGQP
jgi:hypothetical protein